MQERHFNTNLAASPTVLYNILNLAHPDPVAKAELTTKVIIV